MKEDYLWNKTGNDPEIEKLENALKTFRQKDLTPPALPQKTFVFENANLQAQKRKRYFQIAFASFASVFLVVFSIGIFQAFQTENQETVQNSSEVISNKVEFADSKSDPKPAFEEKDSDEDFFETKIENRNFKATPKVKRKIRKAKKQKFSKLKVKETFAKKEEPKSITQKPFEKKVELTEEEKYAYDQLMKALAITSSKLKLVKDKVQGVEEDETALSK